MAQKTKPSATKIVSTKHNWTAERLRDLQIDRLRDLRERSIRLASPDLTALCDAELADRSERQARMKPAATAQGRRGGVVTEYHFVCAHDRGVIREADGTFRTGSWVVAENLVQASLRHGALVALHEAKALPPYRQGSLLSYQLTARDMIDKDSLGIEFHVRPTPEALPWIGDGAGEKGYRWE